jgi:thiol-disulfide isomerase/thioredoxin
MKRIILLIVLNAIAFLGFAQDNHPVSWKFSSEKIAPLTYKLKLEATVQEPYHIYPQEASGGGMGMPTEFIFVEDPNVEFVGTMEEKGVEQKGDDPVAYYAKGVTFFQMIKLKSEKETTLAFTLKYMACTNQFCLPPSKKEYTLAINGQAETSATAKDNSSSVSSNQEASFKYEDFVMANADGKQVSSIDITSKSKYTFIDFWASWCAPCRAQGRELIPMYNKYNSKGFNVIAVSLDTKTEPWRQAIQADKYTWTNLSDLKGFESAIAKKYNIIAIPRNLLIDDKGNIVAMDIHGKELEAKLATLFK